MTRVLVTVLVCMAMCGCAFAKTAPLDTTRVITIEPLNDHLRLITLVGGSEFNLPLFGTRIVASVGPDGILLVDAGFESTGQVFADTLRTLGDGRVRVIVYTHYHDDHTPGGRFIPDRPTIIAHRGAHRALSGQFYHLSGPPAPYCPNLACDDSLTLWFNGEEVKIMHAPNAHTQGDVFVYFTASNVVAVGDLIFPDEFPYVDLPDSGTVVGYTAQIRRLIDQFPDDVTFIASHGRAYGKTDLATYHRMLTETSAAVRAAVAAGKTLEQVLSERVLAPWESWTGSFPTTTMDAWTRTLYAEAAGWTAGKPSVCDPMTAVLASGSATEAITRFRELQASQPDSYDFGEAHINMLGYQLLARQRFADALGIFAFNVELFPDAWNVYDSYGEALALTGDTAGAIVNYERSLQLNPESQSAPEALKRLRRQ